MRTVLVSRLCVVTRHLTSRVFVRLTNDETYLTGNEGQTVFSEKCSVAELQPCTANAIFIAASISRVPRVRSSPRVCTSVLFILLHDLSIVCTILGSVGWHYVVATTQSHDHTLLDQ